MKANSLIVAIFVLGGLCLAQTAEPSLGEVAKQKSAKKAAKTVTDEDMPQHPKAAAPAPPAVAAVAADAAKPATAATDAKPVEAAQEAKKAEPKNDEPPAVATARATACLVAESRRALARDAPIPAAGADEVRHSPPRLGTSAPYGQKRLLARSGRLIPRCSQAAAVATRPRGVRFTKPRCRR